LTKLITVIKAKEEVKRLNEYIEMVESYQADTLEKFIIKEYSYTNSITEIVKRLARRDIKLDGRPVEREYVTMVIKRKASDPLHRMMKSWYLRKSKKSSSL
jgi:hypothetical protein